MISCSCKYLLFYFILVFIFYKIAGKSFTRVTTRRITDVYLHEYNADGEVKQLVYAYKAIMKEDPLITYVDKFTGKTIMIALHKLKSRLSIITSYNRRIYLAPDNSTCYGVCGYTPDNQATLSFLYSQLINHYYQYNEYPTIDTLSHQLSTWFARALYPDDVSDGQDAQEEEEDVENKGKKE